MAMRSAYALADSDSDAYEFIFKVLLIGSSNVGKTCMLLRGTGQKFNDAHHLTIGVDF